MPILHTFGGMHYLPTNIYIIACLSILVCLPLFNNAESTACNILNSTFNLENCSCPTDYYGPENNGEAHECIQCPKHLTSVSGSKNITSCGCPEGSLIVPGSIGINSCVCTSDTSVLIEGVCVDVCHIKPSGCPCHLSAHGELVNCIGWSASGDLAATNLSRSQMGSPYVFSVLEFGVVHACAIRYPSGGVVCWNMVTPPQGGTRPQADAPRFITGARALSLGPEHSCALWGLDNILTCWGVPGAVGRTAEVQVSRNIRMLATGNPTSRHVCFLYVSKMFVSCIGSNTHGQLGIGVGGAHITQLHAEDIVSYQ